MTQKSHLNFQREIPQSVHGQRVFFLSLIIFYIAKCWNGEESVFCKYFMDLTSKNVY